MYGALVSLATRVATLQVHRQHPEDMEVRTVYVRQPGSER